MDQVSPTVFQNTFSFNGYPPSNLSPFAKRLLSSFILLFLLSVYFSLTSTQVLLPFFFPSLALFPSSFLLPHHSDFHVPGWVSVLGQSVWRYIVAYLMITKPPSCLSFKQPICLRSNFCRSPVIYSLLKNFSHLFPLPQSLYF